MQSLQLVYTKILSPRVRYKSVSDSQRRTYDKYGERLVAMLVALMNEVTTTLHLECFFFFLLGFDSKIIENRFFFNSLNAK